MTVRPPLSLSPPCSPRCCPSRSPNSSLSFSLALSCLLSLPLLAAMPALAAEPGVAQRQANIERALPPAQIIKGAAAAYPSLADEMARLNVPGVSVAVIRKGKIAWAKGYGVVAAGGAPVTPATLFQAASISKPVAAMGALALVQAGRMDLDADINTYLSSWKLRSADGAEATASLSQLLSHTGGASVSGFPGYPAAAALPSVQQVLDGAAPANTKAVRVDSTPGQAFRYSGGGYTVAQLAMSERSGAPFAALLARTVLAPAGMRDSSFTQPASAAILARAALPHNSDGTPVAGGPHTYPELAAAGLWTNPSDLARFAIELQHSAAGHGKVLKAAAARRMFTPLKNNYGLGIGIDDDGARAFSHGGSNKGYQNLLFVYAGKGDGAVVMTNSDAGATLAGDLVRAIAAEYQWPGYRSVERSAVAVDPAQAKALAGTFEVPQLGDFSISEQDGKLTLWLRPGEGHALYAQSASTWFVLGQKLELRFDQAGAYDSGSLVKDGSFNVAFARAARAPK